ncbi:hypothetical protein BGZ90_004789, partial [Linnemannia elongata]
TNADSDAAPDSTLDAHSDGGEPGAVPEDEEPSPTALTFMSTGLRLAIGFNDGTVNIYDTQSKDLLTTTTIRDQEVSALACSPNNQELAIGGMNGVIVFWDPESDKLGNTLHFATAGVCRITYSPWKEWLVFGDGDNRIYLCRRSHLQSELSDVVALWCVVSVVEGFIEYVRDIAWNPVIRNEFVTGCLDRSVRVWRILEGENGGDGSISVELVWGSNIGMLGAAGMRLDGVVGLDAGSRRLLKQRGAVGDFLTIEKDEADVGSSGVLETASEVSLKELESAHVG